MKVLLIAPPQWAAYGSPMRPVYPPMGLLQIAACLESEGHSVRVVDADGEGADIHGVRVWARRWQPDIVGFTATTPAFPAARRWAARMRSAVGCPVLIGGPHASALPGEVLATGCFDAVFQGEAENAITEYCALLVRQEPDLSVSGVVRPDEPAVPRTLLTEGELNDLPLPAWHLVRRPSGYRPPDARALPVGTIMLSRGCPGRCGFCQSTSLFGAKVRYLTPERAVEHAWHVRQTIGAREIHIMDDCFTADRDRAMAIMEAFASRGPRIPYAFGNGLRCDMLDDGLLSAMRTMGVHSFGMGIETSNDAVAVRAGKHQSLDRATPVIDAAHRLGMTVWGFFMLGLPGESANTLVQTAHFSRSLGLDVAKFEIFKPYPGTRLYDELIARKAILSPRWSDWGIHTPPVHRSEGLPPRDVWRARRSAVLAFYRRPKALSSLTRHKTFTQRALNANAAWFLLKTLLRMP